MGERNFYLDTKKRKPSVPKQLFRLRHRRRRNLSAVLAASNRPVKKNNKKIQLKKI